MLHRRIQPLVERPRRAFTLPGSPGRAVTAVVLSCAIGTTFVGCGAGAGAPASPAPIATATPAPNPTPTPSQPTACALTSPKVDCATRPVNTPDLANSLQEAIDAALRTGGVMYPDDPNRVYDLQRFRAIVVSTLAAGDMCGAWDYG
ncbi:MAG TPA: hypothetical protein VF902_02795, partial [Coriobacteriia bacterium]